MTKTKPITYGAMCCGIYALLLLINQQTSLLLESSFSFIFAFPILVYTAMFGGKYGLVTGFSMILLTFFLGGFTTWIYSISSIAIGWGFGAGVYLKQSFFYQILWTFFISCLANYAILGVWAKIFGLDSSADMEMLNQFLPWLNWPTYLAILIVFTSVLESACIVLMARLLLVRLKIKMAPVPNLLTIQPSKTIGLVSIFIWVIAIFVNMNVIKLGNDGENLIFLVIVLDFFILDFYGILHVFKIAVQKQNRLLAALAVLGAFVPGLNLVCIGLGEWDSLKRLVH